MDASSILQALMSAIPQQAPTPQGVAAMTPAQETQYVQQTAAQPSTFSKIMSGVGSIANIAGSVLPGPIGLIAKTAGKVLNDDEWWENERGNEATMNQPLAFRNYTVKYGNTTKTVWAPRPGILCFSGSGQTVVRPNNTPVAITNPVMDFDSGEFTSYVIPAVRKVVNATDLRDVGEYQQVFIATVMLYATRAHLRKIRDLTQMKKPFMPDYTDGSFPILTAANKAWLDSTIEHLDLKLKSSARLPHTLCQYLTWRFGRVFRMSDSARSGIVIYSPAFALDTALTNWDTYIANAFDLIAEFPQAYLDLYNAWDTHEQNITIPEDTKFRYDCKEFCLRLNLSVNASYPSNKFTGIPRPVVIDSDLNNQATFMATTMSTEAGVRSNFTPGTAAVSCLFPVGHAYIYAYFTNEFISATGGNTSYVYTPCQTPLSSHHWGYLDVQPQLINTDTDPSTSVSSTVHVALQCFMVSYYNCQQYVAFKYYDSAASNYKDVYIDVTAMSMDTGFVEEAALTNEHEYALANLASDTKHYDTRGEKRQEAIKETLDVVKELPPVPTAPKSDSKPTAK